MTDNHVVDHRQSITQPVNHIVNADNKSQSITNNHIVNDRQSVTYHLVDDRQSIA